MGKPIAGKKQYPFVINGIMVTSAKIANKTYINELYLLKQRSYNVYDLISLDGNLYQYVHIATNDSDGNLLDYNKTDLEVAESLKNNTFCIREADVIHNKFGFGILYQYNKIKLHNGEVIFRPTTLKPIHYTTSINPALFDIIVGNTQFFEVKFDPSAWEPQTGQWKYDEKYFKLKSNTPVTQIELTATAPVKSTTVSFIPDSPPSIPSKSTGIIKDNLEIINNLSLEPNKITKIISDEFSLSVVYDPVNYLYKDGTWNYDKSILKLNSSDGTGASFTAIDKGTSDVTFTLKHDPSKVATSAVTINDYNEIKSIKFDPSSVDGVANTDGTVSIIYDPDVDILKGGVWKFNDDIVSINDSKDTELDYHLIIHGKTDGIFHPHGKLAPGVTVPTLPFNIRYADLEDVILYPDEVKNIVPGDTGKIDINYKPTEAQYGGTWAFDPEGIVVEDESKSTDTEMYYIAKKPGKSTAIFHTKAAFSRDPRTVSFEVLHSELKNITLDPASETVTIGQDFYIDIHYDPDTSPHAGSWNLDKISEYVKLEDDSTPDKAHFTALKEIDSIDLIYTQGKISATNKCTINYSPLESIKLSPSEETVTIGQDFYIDIEYSPDTAEHKGTWNLDKISEYVKLEDDSTPDKAHFTALKETDGIDLIFSNGNVHSNPCKCTINFNPLKSIKITPTEQTVTIGQDFYIDIEYSPDTAEHTGSWNTKDFSEYLKLEDDSTPDKAHFTALKETDGIDLIFSNGDIHSNTSKCIINFNPLKSIKLTPSEETVMIGQDFYIDIEYSPDTAEHTGSWNLDEISDYVKLEDDSTPDKAHFTALKETKGINLIFSNGDIHSNPCKCIINYNPLESIKITPSEQTVTIGQDFYIDIEYSPDTAEHTGSWNIDKISEYLKLEDDSTPDKAHFTALKETDGIDLIFSNGDIHSNTSKCIITYNKLESIKLSPTEETVTIGQEFYIDIEYVPDTAEHTGTWSYDKTYVKLEDDSTPDKAHFTALKETDEIDLTYSQGDVSATNKCTINFNPLKSITLTPSEQTITIGQDFFIDIEYSPDTAEHTGSWNMDHISEYVKLEDDSTSDKAHFTALKETDGIDLIFSNGDIHSNPSKCIINYSPLKSISLTPTEETVTIGQDFYIDIHYDPDTAKHDGSWNIDKISEYVKLEDDSTPDKAHFTALKEIDSIDLIYSQGDISATNKCTINYSPLESITLTPSNQTVKVGEDFYIDIKYSPDTAEHTGTWNTKDFSKYLKLEDDSTPDRAHFTALSVISEIDLIFSNGDIHSNTNKCSIDFSDLESITLNPESESVNVGQSFTIDITYTPDTAEHTGSWTYDKTYLKLEDDSTPDKAHFTVIAKPTTNPSEPLTLTYTSNNKSATNKCTILHDILQDIKLSPAYEEVFPDDEFEVDITYVPDTAEHTGSWRTELGDTGEDADEYVQLLPKSTPDKAYFKALKLMPTESIKLIYTSADKSATNICDIFYDRLTGIVLDPTHETVKGGDSFKIKITYVPDTAKHIGEWDLDHNYFNEEDDSTKDLAHFTVVDYTPEVQTLTYTSAGISAKNECTITPIELKSINLSPSSESVKALDEFFIDITYDPPASDHTGAKWNTDEFKEYVELLPDSTDKRAHFKALKRSEKPINLTLSKDSVSATNTCNIDYSDLKDISITYDPDFKKLPGEQYILGDKFTANITFIPDTAEHKEGVWKFNDAEGCARIDSQDIQSTKFTSIKTTPSNFRKLPTYTVGDISKETFFVIGYADLTELKLSPEDFPSTLVNKRVGPITTTYSPSTASISSAQWDGDLDYVIGLSGTNTTTSYVVAKKDTIPGGNKIRKKCIVNTNKPDEFIYSNYIIVNATSSPLESFIIKTDNKADPSTVEMKLYQNATITVVNTPSNAIYNGTWDVEDKSYFLVAGPNQLNNTYSLVANKESDKPIKVTYTEGGVAKHVTITKITK